MHARRGVPLLERRGPCLGIDNLDGLRQRGALDGAAAGGLLGGRLGERIGRA